MSKATIYSKKAFLKAMATLIDDDELVMCTQFTDGKMNVKGKKGEKYVEAGIRFPIDALKRNDTLGHFMKNFMQGISLLKESDLAPEGIKIVEYQDKYHKIKK